MHGLFARIKYLPLVLLCSCQLFTQVKDSSKSLKELPQYWLSTSLYVGDFFGEDDTHLVDFRPFLALEETKEPKPRITDIIKAGTLVKIVRISHPGEQADRALVGPQNNIWVHLLIAKERGLVSYFWPNEYILVLPSHISSKDAIKSYLAQVFSKKDPNAWILPLPSHIQEGIYKKRPVLGMNAEQLKAALGPAFKKQTQAQSDFNDAQEIWEYPHFFVVMIDGLVSKVKSIGE